MLSRLDRKRATLYPTLMYSRLAHHEGNGLVRQILFFFGASVGLVILFLLVILPAFIKFLAFRNFSSKITYTTDSVLPPHPFLNQPFDATNSATITLTGSSQGGQKIVLLQNGAPGAETTASENGSFSFASVTLEAGQNTFTTVAQNEKGDRSNPSNAVIIAFVKDAPKLTIDTPANDTTISQRKQNPVTVKGKSEAGNKIYINDRLIFVGSDGSFTGQVQLVEGDNTISVKAINAAAIETIQEILVRFSP